MKKVIGYIRLSVKAGDRTAGYGEETQEKLIRQFVALHEHEGWELLRIERDLGESGKDLRRPGMQAALNDLTAGVADVLLVAKLDRLSRNLSDFALLMERARNESWSLIAMDVGLDMSTPVGSLMANILASFAQYEREQLIERTKAGMARAREAGKFPGKPSSLTRETVELILSLKGSGLGYRSIVRELTERGIQTPRGGAEWYPSTVRGIIKRETERANV